jgi:hypothetical protein
MARRKKTAKTRSQGMSNVANKASFRELCRWFLPSASIFSALRIHGNTKWKPMGLVWLAIVWSWSDSRALTDALVEAVYSCDCLFGVAALRTYQGFMGALVTWTPHLMPILQRVVRERMESLGSKHWRVDDWLPIAFDGSRSSAPRTKSNEKKFCARNYGQGSTAKYRKKKSKGMRRVRNEKNKAHAQEPQAWITMMWHMGLRLPWDWRLGPTDSSERQHVMDMIRDGIFPRQTLFCGDAGFVGYAFWQLLMARERNFLVRVGANVRLLSEYARVETVKKGKDRIVLCWPKAAQAAQSPPLRLRLLRVRVGKKASAWLLTSVLDREKLSVKTALRLYLMRWGVEVEFRGLKQTLDRGKLRCRNAERLLAELDWSILAMAIAELVALREQSTKAGKGQSADPARCSLANTMRALRHCLRHLKETPKRGEDLASKLRAATTDGYRRKISKRARYRPKNPDKKRLGDPTIRPMDTKERQKLKENSRKIAA